MRRLAIALLALLLAFPAAAQLVITNTGKITLKRADGTTVSQHNEVKEAYERATVEGAGSYTISFPQQRLVYTLPAAKPCPACPVDPPPAPPPPPPPPAPPAGDFNLPLLAADPITGTVAKPARGGSYVDPVYKTTVTRATQASDGGGSHLRHEYSRRQAFNADRSRYLAQASNGYWWLYNRATHVPIRRLSGMAGDCEPIWSATNPRTLIYTGQNGGMKWWTKDVETDTDTLLFDFAGKTPWPQATSFWTKGEGTASADGRILGLMATRYDSANQRNVIHGLVVLDTVSRSIIATMPATAWGGGFPDHVSTSPSGKYVVPSWAHQPALGTRACPVASFAYANCKLLHAQSEHSDLAYGPGREDFYVYADYGTGHIVAKNIDTLAAFNLLPLYPRSGSAYAVHVSGQAFDRPGYVVLSTYADSASYGSTVPDPVLQPMYRKVLIAELKPSGRAWSVAHVRGAGTGYFDEPQATASRDLRRIIYASNLGSGASDSYVVDVP